MLFGEDLGGWIQHVDYGTFLPLMAKLPLSLGEKLAQTRGIIHAMADYDWRSMTLKHKYVRTGTYQAMQMLSTDADKFGPALKTVKRFVHHSREEWQACLFNHKVMSEISRKSSVEGIEQLLNLQGRGRGIVMVSCHLDSFCMGMTLMGMKGLRVNVVNTSMIENPIIHPTVRSFFNRKYRSMEYHMKGKMEYYQTDMPFFYKALEKGETVALMGDIPGSKSKVYISFLGRRFRMPLGAWHLAKKTGSAIGAFVCLHKKTGCYKVICTPPQNIDPDDPLKTLLPIYSFLEEQIKQYPQRWICSELLPTYGTEQ